MRFKLPFSPAVTPPAGLAPPPEEHWLPAGPSRVRVWLVPNRRARRYVLRLRADGTARLTIPRGGSAREALRFAERNAGWLERQLMRRAARPVAPTAWGIGSQILFRGEAVRLEAVPGADSGSVRLGSETIPAQGPDFRPAVERHLRRLATRELTERVFQLAAIHQFDVKRVTVRNQRSRWGSCSRRGTISLNWRLLQAPPFVRDYIVLHELAHLKEMNHSRRFWVEVARLYPAFEQAEAWLKQHRATEL